MPLIQRFPNGGYTKGIKLHMSGSSCGPLQGQNATVASLERETATGNALWTPATAARGSQFFFLRLKKESA